jgi:hypothetical protein
MRTVFIAGGMLIVTVCLIMALATWLTEVLGR